MSQANGFAYAATITPADGTDQPPFDTLQVASIAGGAVVVFTPAEPIGSPDITYTGVTVGMEIPAKVKRVKTGTTALLVGLMRG